MDISRSLHSITCLTNRILNCLNIMIPLQSKASVTVPALNVLMLLAKGPFSKQILDCDVSQYLWLTLLPPKYLHKDTDVNKGKWKVVEWWPIYLRGIELVRILLDKHKKKFSNEAIIFVGVQEEFIVDAIVLCRHSLEPGALNLSLSALKFIDQLVKHIDEWRKEHQQSVINIMNAIQTVFEYSVSLIYRPRTLRCHIDGVTVDLSESTHQNTITLPSEKVVLVINKLIEIITLCSRTLLVFSPSVLILLTESHLQVSNWKPIVQMQFGAPKLHSQPNSSISFGTITAAACLFTKALTTSFTPKGKLLNTLNAPIMHNESEINYSKSTLLDKTSVNDKSNACISIKQTSQTIKPISPIINLNTTTNSLLLTNDWLSTFDTTNTLFALESVMTFLASQALFFLRDPHNSSRDQQLIRRELCTELSGYHEFVRKKILDTHLKNPLIRKKLGVCTLISKGKPLESDSGSSDDSDDSPHAPHPPPPKRSSETSMRVSVVRKQHLDLSKTAHSSTFASSNTASSPSDINSTFVSKPHYQHSVTPISNFGLNAQATSTGCKPVDSITNLLHGIPNIRSLNQDQVPSRDTVDDVNAVMKSSHRPHLDLSEIPKHVTWSSDDYAGSPMSVSPYDGEMIYPILTDSYSRLANMGKRKLETEEIIMYPPEEEESRYFPLTDVQMTEEDYLHFLSNLFSYVCPTDNY